MALLLISACAEHLDASIIHPVAPTTVRLNHHRTNAADVARLLARRDYHDLRWWGMTANNSNQFTGLMLGDEVLISQKDTGLMNFHGIVEAKITNPDPTLAGAIWDSDHENIFILKPTRGLAVNKTAFVTALGYRPKYNIQGPNLIRNARFRTYLGVKRRFRI